MVRIVSLVALFGVFLSSSLQAKPPVTFRVRLLTIDANEGCDIADVDEDGKLDVVAGRNWFQNGDWTPRPVRLIDDWNGYVQSNGEFLHDVNHDGRKDVVSMDFTDGSVYWYENPGQEQVRRGMLWPAHLLADTEQKNNEAAYFVDIDGDGTPEWIVNQWNKANPMVVWQLQVAERDVEVKQGRKTVKQRKEVPVLVKHQIGDINGHGIGFGDLNNDGREDIVFGLGWYERPSGDPLNQAWKYHDDWELHASCPMLVYDVDGDQVNDMVWSLGHDYGLFFWRGLGPDDKGTLQFDKQTVDKSFSQAHCLHLADLDGDGTNELITGKRVRAHNGKDPGSSEPPVICYFTWDATQKKFVRHAINEGQVGAGLQIRTADLDGDGDTDIVVAGKEGTQILFNLLRD